MTSTISATCWSFSSSGARPLYLENVVRTLALQTGDSIQYRYETSIVSESFKAAFSARSLVGNTVYLCYFDNGASTGSQSVIPIRRAEILSVKCRGSSYITALKLGDFLKWNEEMSTEAYSNLAIDELPKKVRGQTKSQGFFVGKVEKCPPTWFESSGELGSSHLEAFENTVQELVNGSQFKASSHLFLNLLGVRKSTVSETRTLFSQAKYTARKFLNQWHVTRGLLDSPSGYARYIKAGSAYDLIMYHYVPSVGGSTEWSPFVIEVESNNAELKFLSNQVHYAEAEYDEVICKFIIPDDFKTSSVGLNITVKKAAPDGVPVLRAGMELPVRKTYIGRVIQTVIVATGLIGGQAIALHIKDLLDLPGLILISIFGILAAIGIVFRIGRK